MVCTLRIIHNNCWTNVFPLISCANFKLYPNIWPSTCSNCCLLISCINSIISNFRPRTILFVSCYSRRSTFITKMLVCSIWIESCFFFFWSISYFHTFSIDFCCLERFQWFHFDINNVSWNHFFFINWTFF